jgi:hypothetical protein
MTTSAIAISMLGLASMAAAAQAEPSPPPLTYVFEETFAVGPAQVVGDTPAGRRQSVPVMGGSFAGPGISGRVLAGGADEQLVRPDGAVTIDARFVLETADHVRIGVHNVGVVVPPRAGQAAYALSAQSFEAPDGRYSWLNSALFVSRIGVVVDKDHRMVRLTVFKVG